VTPDVLPKGRVTIYIYIYIYIIWIYPQIEVTPNFLPKGRVTIGVTSGASTPDATVEVRARLSSPSLSTLLRPSVRPSVSPSVRPSVPSDHLLSAPPLLHLAVSYSPLALSSISFSPSRPPRSRCSLVPRPSVYAPRPLPRPRRPLFVPSPAAPLRQGVRPRARAVCTAMCERFIGV
jgi:hypothetical protein